MGDNYSIEQARSSWCRAQGLNARRGGSLGAACKRTGWIRTLGGAEAYLGLSARVRDVSAAAVHDAVGRGELRVSPSVRGCMYLVPNEHLALSLRTAQLLSTTRSARDYDKAGIRTGELEGVGDAILDTINALGPATTVQLRGRLPSTTLRSLGERGRAVGITSTLPPALRELEFRGAISRRPVENRLDHERYEWAIPKMNPFDEADLSSADSVYRRLAELYFGWAGPATRKEFAAWTGLSQSDAKKAIAAANLVEVTVEALGGTAYVRADIPPARPADETADEVVFLPALDNLFGMRGSAEPLLRREHHEIEVATFGGGKSGPIRKARQPLDRTIAVGGRIVGTWAWSPDLAETEVHAFEPLNGLSLTLEAERSETLLTELGHGRAFCLDSDGSLRDRLSRMRQRQP